MFTRLDELDPDHRSGVYQVLLRDLRVSREADGLRFEVRLDGTEDVLLGGADKRAAAARQDPLVARAFADEVGRLRRGEIQGPLSLPAEGFAPRHASGGALVELAPPGAAPRWLLAHRDIPPVGWNLVNGASGDRSELGDLDAVIARECAEEALFVDAAGRLRGLAVPAEAEEARAARALWCARLGTSEGPALAAEWIPGPDHLVVHDAGRRITQMTRGIRLTVQAEDYGLECLRGLRIREPGLIPLDGEVAGGTLLDRRLGLFDPDRLRASAGPHAAARHFRNGEEARDDAPSLPLCPVVAGWIEAEGP